MYILCFHLFFEPQATNGLLWYLTTMRQKGHK